jgi:hypothetical protein
VATAEKGAAQNGIEGSVAAFFFAGRVLAAAAAAWATGFGAKARVSSAQGAAFSYRALVVQVEACMGGDLGQEAVAEVGAVAP